MTEIMEDLRATLAYDLCVENEGGVMSEALAFLIVEDMSDEEVIRRLEIHEGEEIVCRED